MPFLINKYAVSYAKVACFWCKSGMFLMQKPHSYEVKTACFSVFTWFHFTFFDVIYWLASHVCNHATKTLHILWNTSRKALRCKDCLYLISLRGRSSLTSLPSPLKGRSGLLCVQKFLWRIFLFEKYLITFEKSIWNFFLATIQTNSSLLFP